MSNFVYMCYKVKQNKFPNISINKKTTWGKCPITPKIASGTKLE